MVGLPVRVRMVHFILVTLLIGFYVILIVCHFLHQPRIFRNVIPPP
jgi:hypothetical protein